MFKSVAKILLGEVERRLVKYSAPSRPGLGPRLFNGSYAESIVVAPLEPPKTTATIAEAVITRRLRRLEGLRAYLKSKFGAFSRTETVHNDQGNGRLSDSLRKPLNKLSTQQNMLIGKKRLVECRAKQLAKRSCCLHRLTLLLVSWQSSSGPSRSWSSVWSSPAPIQNPSW